MHAYMFDSRQWICSSKAIVDVWYDHEGLCYELQQPLVLPAEILRL